MQSVHLVKCLDDIAWLVLLGGEDDVDDLGDGSVYVT